MRQDLRELRNLVHSSWTEPAHVQTGFGSATGAVTLTNTVTTTVSMKPTAASTSERKWFGDTFTVSYSLPTPKAQSESPPRTQDDDVRVEDRHGENEYYDSSYDSDERQGSSLLPMLYLPLTWPAHMHYAQAKAQVLSSWGHLWHVVEIILHWPLPVDS